MSVKYSPSLVTDNLIFYCDSPNTACYSGTGTTAYDLIGSNSITLVNGVTYTSGASGYFTLDGTNDYMSMTLPSLTVYSISFWIYIISYDNTERQILETLGDAVAITLLSGKFHIWNGASNSGSTSFSTGQWYNVVCTRSGSSTKLYLNGVSDGTFATGASIPSGTATIGMMSSSRYLNARVANFNFYSVELSSTDILQNYYSLKSRYNL